MNHARDRGNVGKAVKPRPTLSSQPLDHLVCRRYCQWNHKHKGDHAHKNKRTLDNVLPHANQIEESIKPNIGEEMERAIEKREQSEHASIFNQRVNAKDFSERCDSDCYAEENERQHARGPGGKLERIWTDAFMVNVPQKQNERDESVDEEDEFRVRHN